MGERYLDTVEVSGSIPLAPTTPFREAGGWEPVSLFGFPLSVPRLPVTV